MNEVRIELNNGKYIDEIVNLSKRFEAEKCCNGIIGDDANYFKDKEIVVAISDEKVVGYCYGTTEIKQNNTQIIKKGQKVFYLEEIFVDKKFRNKKVGSMLFNFILNEAKKKKCDFLETVAVSKDYKKLLSFYIDQMDMTFWSANLVKKID